MLPFVLVRLLAVKSRLLLEPSLPAVLMMRLVLIRACVLVMVPLRLSSTVPVTLSLFTLSVPLLVKPLLLVKSMPPLAVMLPASLLMPLLI